MLEVQSIIETTYAHPFIYVFNLLSKSSSHHIYVFLLIEKIDKMMLLK